jgi:hypothetical protein
MDFFFAKNMSVWICLDKNDEQSPSGPAYICREEF